MATMFARVALRRSLRQGSAVSSGALEADRRSLTGEDLYAPRRSTLWTNAGEPDRCEGMAGGGPAEQCSPVHKRALARETEGPADQFEHAPPLGDVAMVTEIDGSRTRGVSRQVANGRPASSNGADCRGVRAGRMILSLTARRRSSSGPEGGRGKAALPLCRARSRVFPPDPVALRPRFREA